MTHLQKEDERSRWIFAHQLVEKVIAHPYPRLNIVVCPENIVYDTGNDALFYSLRRDEKVYLLSRKMMTRIWLETKATVAAAVDGSRTFEEYVNYP